MFLPQLSMTQLAHSLGSPIFRLFGFKIINKLLRLLKNAKEHGMKVHGYTEETWNERDF